jgi:hypothetical protein
MEGSLRLEEASMSGLGHKVRGYWEERHLSAWARSVVADVVVTLVLVLLLAAILRLVR